MGYSKPPFIGGFFLFAKVPGRRYSIVESEVASGIRNYAITACKFAFQSFKNRLSDFLVLSVYVSDSAFRVQSDNTQEIKGLNECSDADFWSVRSFGFYCS